MIPFYKPAPLHLDAKGLDCLLQSGQLTNWGQYYQQLQIVLQTYLRNTPTTLVASGTHALELSLHALRYLDMLPPNARIALPSFTFIATAQAIVNAGMTPIFVDIDPNTWTLDISKLYDLDVDAVIPVNIFGVESPGLPQYITIGDISHGFGGTVDGLPNGLEYTISAFSTSITKPFHTVEGGIVCSKHSELIRVIEQMRRWGLDGQYECWHRGMWSKISELHCLVGLCNLSYLQEAIVRKHTIVRLYQQALSGSDVIFQKIPKNTYTTYKDCGILLPDITTRTDIIRKFDEANIGYKLYFSPAAHQTKYFSQFSSSLLSDLSNTENIASRIICLPIYDGITELEVDQIITVIRSVLGG